MKDKDKDIEFSLFDGDENVYEMSMEEAEAEAFDMIKTACSVLGWAIGVPLNQEEVVTHLIIGAPQDVQEIVDGCDGEYDVMIDASVYDGGEQH